MKLIPLSNYITDLRENSIVSPFEDDEEVLGYDKQALELIYNYTYFLKQPLELRMFMPCDNEGKPFKGAPLSPAPDAEWIRWENEREEFLKAKEKVLFAGFIKSIYGFNDRNFELESNNVQIGYWKDIPGYWTINFKSVEDLANANTEIELTDSVIQKLK